MDFFSFFRADPGVHDVMLPIYPLRTADDFSKEAMHAQRVVMGAGDRECSAKESHFVWKEVYGRIALPDEARESHRIALAWRLTREVAERSKVLLKEAPLIEIPTEWQSITTGTALNHTDLPIEEWALTGLLNREPGIRLHPHCATPTELRRFEHAMELLAIELQLAEGCTAVPDMGRLGLQGLIELWPSQEAILAHESNLIEVVQIQIEHKGQTRVAEFIMSITGLRLSAARKFSRVAMWQLREDTAMDQELARAIAIQQVENVIFRAQQDNDKQAELRAHNTLIALRGLLKSVGDNTLDEMQEFIAKLGAEDEEEAARRDAEYDAAHPEDADTPQTET